MNELYKTFCRYSIFEIRYYLTCFVLAELVVVIFSQIPNWIVFLSLFLCLQLPFVSIWNFLVHYWVKCSGRIVDRFLKWLLYCSILSYLFTWQLLTKNLANTLSEESTFKGCIPGSVPKGASVLKPHAGKAAAGSPIKLLSLDIKISTKYKFKVHILKQMLYANAYTNSLCQSCLTFVESSRCILLHKSFQGASMYMEVVYLNFS